MMMASLKQQNERVKCVQRECILSLWPCFYIFKSYPVTIATVPSRDVMIARQINGCGPKLWGKTNDSGMFEVSRQVACKQQGREWSDMGHGMGFSSWWTQDPRCFRW